MSDAPRDPKRLTEWLRLNYFERPRAFARWRRRSLTMAGLLAAIPAFALLAVAFGGPNIGIRSRTLTSSGSQAHASFINKCCKCHVEQFAPVGRLNPLNGEIHSVPDTACLKCHDAGVHSNRQNEFVGTGDQDGQARNCVHCHREHRGPSLTTFSDDTCTRCHADLNSHLNPDGTAPSRFAGEIHFFAANGGHPEFGHWRNPQSPVNALKDPGTLRFSHAAHLDREQIQKMREGVDRRIEKCQDQPEDARRFQGVRAQVERLAEKTCTLCHQIDSRRGYFEPIDYDKHCATCHALMAPLQRPQSIWPDALESVARRIEREPLHHPHSENGPAQARGELLERSVRFLLETKYDPPASPDEPQFRPNLLGRPLSTGQQQFALRQRRAGESVIHGAAPPSGSVHLEQALWTQAGCAYCHTQSTPTSERPDGLPVYLATALRKRWSNLPDRQSDDKRHMAVVERESRVWFPFAEFDHNSHRAVACILCHHTEKGEPPALSKVSSDLLLPNKSDCQQCHNAEKGIRFDCLTCHRYHDRGREGIGLGTIHP